jgi:hypothetical protein
MLAIGAKRVDLEARLSDNVEQDNNMEANRDVTD